MPVKYLFLTILGSIFACSLGYILSVHVFVPLIIEIIKWSMTVSTPDYMIAAMIMFASGFGALVILAIED